jgi:hypothetical protein
MGTMLPGTTVLVASVGSPAYDNLTAKPHRSDLENPTSTLDDKNEETPAAIAWDGAVAVFDPPSRLC